MDNKFKPVKIRSENIWKVFGKNRAKVMAAGLGERQQAAGTHQCTIAVREATFEVREGEVFVVMGLSGSGKSTLLRCLNRLIEPDEGNVTIDGRNVNHLNGRELRKLRQENMAMVFQNFALLPYRTVIDNVAFGLEVQGLTKKDRLRRAEDALELVGLSDWKHRYPHELSGGMQQRVGLARALSVNPEILLMDEAFSALDPLIRKQIQDEFLKLVAIVKKTIVFITHDLDEALKLAHCIAMMKDGQIIQVGTPEEIVMNPADDFVAEFVSSVSRTKVISAKNLMVEPDMWISAENEDPIAVLNKMRRNNLNSVFITDSTNRLVGIVNESRLKKLMTKNLEDLKPIAHKNYASVLPDTNLEDLISQASRTKNPIAVLDERNCLLGVISRSNLLKELANVI